MTYQWYVCTSKEGTWEKIDGATSATYSVTVTAANNGYQYRCEARNADGASFSRAATLKLKWRYDDGKRPKGRACARPVLKMCDMSN